MNRLGGIARITMLLALLGAMGMVFGGCIIRTNAGVGHHANGARSSHRHCHTVKTKTKVVKRDHRDNSRDHRTKTKTKRKCHSHMHGRGHH